MKTKNSKLWLIVGMFFLVSGCSSNSDSSSSDNLEDAPKESIMIKQEESGGDTMKNKAIDTKLLGEKQQEGQLDRENFEQFQPYLIELEKIISVPEGYELQEVQTGIKQNDEEVIRFRYGKMGQEVELGGEHYSAVVRVSDKKLLGLMSIRPESIVSNPEELPTKKEAVDITKAFLDKVETGFFEKLDNLWIDRHDEPLFIDGAKQIVSGTKYKCYVPSKQEYAWVVVDKNREVMIFERGIHWENNGRTTEKWLYDEYLKDGSLDLFAVRKE